MKQLKALAILKIFKNMPSLDDAELNNDFDEAIAELEALQKPKGCNACKYLMDNVCNHPGVPEFYAPQYINYSGCGLHQPIPQQPESKDDPAI